MIDINHDNSNYIELGMQTNQDSVYTKKIKIKKYDVYKKSSYESQAYLETNEYVFIQKNLVDNNLSTIEHDHLWIDELKKSIEKTKEQLASSQFNNEIINKRIVERMTKYTSFKKQLMSALNDYYLMCEGKSSIHTASIFNFLKYIPEFNSFAGEKIVSVDSDLMLITLTLVKEQNRINIVFDKSGEIFFNLSDVNSEALRVSGSAYFPGGLKNSNRINKILGMV